MPDEKQAIIDELDRRGEFKDASKRQVVEELARRGEIRLPKSLAANEGKGRSAAPLPGSRPVSATPPPRVRATPIDSKSKQKVSNISPLALRSASGNLAATTIGPPRTPPKPSLLQQLVEGAGHVLAYPQGLVSAAALPLHQALQTGKGQLRPDPAGEARDKARVAALLHQNLFQRAASMEGEIPIDPLMGRRAAQGIRDTATSAQFGAGDAAMREASRIATDPVAYILSPAASKLPRAARIAVTGAFSAQMGASGSAKAAQVIQGLLAGRPLDKSLGVEAAIELGMAGAGVRHIHGSAKGFAGDAAIKELRNQIRIQQEEGKPVAPATLERLAQRFKVPVKDITPPAAQTAKARLTAPKAARDVVALRSKKTANAQAQADLAAKRQAAIDAQAKQPVPKPAPVTPPKPAVKTPGKPAGAAKAKTRPAVPPVTKTPTEQNVAPPVAKQTASRPPYEMTQAEIDAAYEAERVREKGAPARVFGAGGAKQWQEAQKVTERGSPSDPKVQAADKMIASMERDLTPEQRKDLYGIGEKGPGTAEYQDYSHAIGALAWGSPAELGHSIKRHITNIGDETDPAKMSHSQQVSYAAIRHAMQGAKEKGWALSAVEKAAIEGAAEQHADPEDAALLLRRFNKGPAPTPETAPKALTAAPKDVSIGTPKKEDISMQPTLAENKAGLEKRIQEAHSVLANETKKRFGKGVFDFDGKRLVSDDGTVALQWRPEGGTDGQVSLVRVPVGKKYEVVTVDHHNYMYRRGDVASHDVQPHATGLTSKEASDMAAHENMLNRQGRNDKRLYMYRPIEGEINATQAGVQPEGAPTKRKGNDSGGSSAKTGSSSRVQPAAKVQGKTKTVSPVPQKVPPVTEKAKPPPATLSPRNPVTLTAAEANTLGLYFDRGHALGDDLSNAKKPFRVAASQANYLRKLVEQKGLDKAKFPALYPDVPRKGLSRKDIQVQEKGPQELHTGIPLDKVLEAVVGRKRGQSWIESVTKFGQSLRGLVNPTGFGNGSEVETRAGRDYFGQQARIADQREQAFKPLRAAFDRLPAGRGVKFMFDVEGGNVHADPKAQEIGDLLRDTLDKKREQVNAQTGKLDAYFEHYFPHEWKSPSKAMQLFGEGNRPLEGSKKFLRRRTIPTNEAGMFPKGAPVGLDKMSEGQIREEIDRQGGLQPLTLNPIEMAQLKLQSMDRYLYAQKWFAEMKQQGRAVYLPIGKPMPDGWAKIHDSISDVRQVRETTKADGSPGAPEIIERGSWIVPEGAARVVNNHLSAGLSGHETFGSVYRVLAATNNAMNMAQLGLSGFHATTMAMESLVSENARALSKATQGKVVEAGQAALWSHTGMAPFRDYYRGSKVLQEYRVPGSVGGDVPKIVESLVKGGGRVTLAKEFRLDAIESFGKALRKRDVPGMALSALPATLEGSMAWLMRDTVPKMKLGAFAELLEDEMGKATKGGKKLTEDQHREIASRAWDSIENRFGQLNYDNLFWDKAFKESGHLAVRSLGWNLGTVREIGGSAVDIGRTRSRLAAGGSVLTPRMTYTLSLAYTTALAGAVYSYLHGHRPETPEDYFHPKNHSGQRITLPGYGKDVQHYATDPLGTIYSKKSPLISTALETLQNKDFFSNPIRNPNDPAVRQAQDYMRYLEKQVIPFSVRPKKGDSVTETAKKVFTTEEGREQAMGITPYHPKKGQSPQSNRGGGISVLPRASTPRLPRLSVPRIP